MFPDLDFSSIKTDEGEVEAKEGQEEVGQEGGGEVVTKGVVDDVVVGEPGEANREEVSPGEVALGDDNPIE